jgi:hypothetical protein
VTEEPELVVSRGAQGRCPYCHDELSLAASTLVCESCEAAVHAECWTESGGRCPSCSWSTASQPTEAGREKGDVEAPEPLRPAARPRGLQRCLQAQAAGLLLATGLAALFSAEGAATVGAVVLGLGANVGMLVGAMERRVGWALLCVVANGLMAGVAAGLIDGLDIRASKPSAILVVTGLVCVVISLSLARSEDE